MSKKNLFSIKNENKQESHEPYEIKSNDIYYNCTECPSLIEILSINEENSSIEFKCLGSSRHEKNMSIKEYLEKMKKYNNKIINDDICKVHYKKSNKFVTYCLDCNLHLCKECLESRNHINHNKNNIIEVKPIKEELFIIKEIIKNYKIKLENLMFEKINKNRLIEDSINNKKINENKILEEKIIINKKNEEKDLKINNDKNLLGIEIKKKKYEKEIIKIMNEFKKDNNNIKKNYKLMNEKENILYEKKTKELNKKYNEEINKLNYNKKIENMIDFKRLNEIILNSYYCYSNNYYNAININNLLLNYYKNEYIKNKIMKKVLKNNLKEIIFKNEKQKNYKKEKKEEILKINEIIENNENKMNKIKEENENNIKKYKKKIMLIEGKYDKKLKKYKEVIDNINKELNKLNPKISSKLKNIIVNFKNEITNNTSKVDKSFQKNNTNPKNIQFLSNLTKNSFVGYAQDNTFTVFKSINDILYLIYTNENRDIISYNLINNKIINIIKNAHEKYITNFRYYSDKRKDLIISISQNDNNIKLWNVNNFECLLNIKNIYKNGELYSACFLYDNNHIYIITSNYNWKNSNLESIKIFNLKGKIIKEIEDSDDNTFFIYSYYDNNLYKNYIITGNKGYVKSYDYIQNKIYHKYSDNNTYPHCSLTINSNDKIIKLIESCDDGNIRIWDFHSEKLLNKIKVNNNYLFGICLWNDEYLFVGSDDKKIRIINLNQGTVIKVLTGHNNYVLTIKKIIHPDYGECIISQGHIRDQIKLWINNY